MRTFRTNKRWRVALAATVLIPTVLGITSSANAAEPQNLPASLVTQSTGSLSTGVQVTSESTPHWPAVLNPADPNTITVNFVGVVTGAEPAAPVEASDGILAVWCANVKDVSGVRTPLTGADINTQLGVAANCTPFAGTPPLTASVPSSGTVVVTGDLDPADLPAGRTCESGIQGLSGPTAIPCLLVLANLAQTVAMAFPIANITAAAVQGPASLVPTFGSGLCNSSAAPPTTCPVTRVGVSTLVGGVGFYPSDMNASIPTYLVAKPTWDACEAATPGGCGPAPSVPAEDENYSVVSVALCDGVLATSTCNNDLTVAANPAAGGAPVIVVSNVGQLAGFFTVNEGTDAGDYFVKVTAAHYASTGSAVVNLVTQVHLSGLRVLRTGGPETSNLTLTPIKGGIGATTVATLTNVNPFATVTFEVLDLNGTPIAGRSEEAEANALGVAVSGPLVMDYPAAKVQASGDIDGLFDGFVTAGTGDDISYTLEKPFDSTDFTLCADSEECPVGLIVEVEVLPGNVSIYARDNVVEVEDIDLSLIQLDEEDSWYVVSEPGTTSEDEPILMGDFTGGNTGFTVTAGSNDLLGSEQSTNTIPAQDVWITAIECDALDQENEFNESLGVATAGDEQTPDPDDALENVLAEGEFEVCAVDPDEEGDNRVGGIFFMVFDVSIAGRPVTAVDEYTGLMTLTIAIQP
jgi:hypothetical protein